MAGIDNKSNHIFIALALWTMVSLNFIGCAGAKAASPRNIAERTITSEEIDQVAQKLVADIINSLIIEVFSVDKKGNENIVISLMLFKNNTDELGWTPNGDKGRELFIAVEKQFAKNNLYFRQELDPNMPGYLQEWDQVIQKRSIDPSFYGGGDDKDDGFYRPLDKPAPRKLVLGLELEVLEITNSNPENHILEYKFIARIINEKTNKTLCVATEKVQK
ncbi:MAG: hypothetical protein EXS12_09075 [Phycisphaerales bacterium]|nr:hypothetical protein [Phycisphaerales bacterium]